MKIPTDLKDIKALREFLTTVRTQICGMADCLSEPWKTHYNDLKAQYDSALASLPATDMVPAAMDASNHLCAFFSCLANANALVGMLGTAMNSLLQKNDQAVALALNSAVDVRIQERLKAGELVMKADVDGLVTTAITTRTTAGDLVPKETVTQLCSAAKDLGLQEGEKKVREEQVKETERRATITTRKGLIQTCGLPLPEEKLESVLGGTEDEFKAAQKLAEDRISGLQKKGIALNSKSTLSMKVWLPKEQWETFEELIVTTLKGGDPLLTPPNTTPDRAPAGIY